MAKNSTQQVGRGLDGSLRLTIGIIIGLVLILAGVGLIAYLQTAYSLIFGVPLLLLGLLIPIILQFALAGNGEQ